jgi:pSer/pThr/pTyr-binding forkhead associated (FHA) protein
LHRLDHPHVSRRHARLLLDGGRVRLHDLGSARGAFVIGRRLTEPVVLTRGDKIDIGPFALEFTGDAAWPATYATASRIGCRCNSNSRLVNIPRDPP